MDKGIYCLVFRNRGCTIPVGALGDLTFQAGWHIYVGSALGSGGLQRLSRHFSLACLHNKRPKWHVDYLLTNPDFSLCYAIYGITQTAWNADSPRNSSIQVFRLLAAVTAPAHHISSIGSMTPMRRSYWHSENIRLIPA